MCQADERAVWCVWDAVGWALQPEQREGGAIALLGVRHLPAFQ